MVRFNLPQYVLGGTALIAGISVAAVPSLPVVIRLAGAIGGGLAGWWTIASLIAGHVVYDRSDLYGGRWLTELLPEAPGRWANVTAGYDESSLPLRARLRGTGTTIDLYDPGLMGEPSIRRAHAVCPPPGDALRASPDHLPLGDRELDAAFVVFAAHELRNAGDREALFGELARVVRPAGRIVVVEHPRDLANLVAFGPGALHFLPRREWVNRPRLAGLTPVGEGRVTPFVRAFVWAAGSPDAQVVDSPGRRSG